MARIQNTAAANVNVELTGAQKAAATRAANKAPALASAAAEAEALAKAEQAAARAATRAANKAAKDALLATATAAPVVAPAATLIDPAAFFPQAPAAAPVPPTTRTPEQQAALDAARNAKAAASATKPAFTPEQEAAAQSERMLAAAATFMDELNLPSWKRVLCGFVLGILAAGCVGWTIGVLAGTLIVGAVALTGMAWVAWVVYILGIVVAMYAGMRTSGAVYGYIVDKVVDRHVDAVKSTVGGWFGRGKAKAVEAVQQAGAFVKPTAPVAA